MDMQLVRVKDAAAMLGMPRSIVYAMVAGGELPAVRRGRAIRLDRADVLRWIEAHKFREFPVGNGAGAVAR